MWEFISNHTVASVVVIVVVLLVADDMWSDLCKAISSRKEK